MPRTGIIEPLKERKEKESTKLVCQALDNRTNANKTKKKKKKPAKNIQKIFSFFLFWFLFFFCFFVFFFSCHFWQRAITLINGNWRRKGCFLKKERKEGRGVVFFCFVFDLLFCSCFVLYCYVLLC